MRFSNGSDLYCLYINSFSLNRSPSLSLSLCLSLSLSLSSSLPLPLPPLSLYLSASLSLSLSLSASLSLPPALSHELRVRCRLAPGRLRFHFVLAFLSQLSTRAAAVQISLESLLAGQPLLGAGASSGLQTHAVATGGCLRALLTKQVLRVPSSIQLDDLLLLLGDDSLRFLHEALNPEQAFGFRRPWAGLRRPNVILLGCADEGKLSLSASPRTNEPMQQSCLHWMPPHCHAFALLRSTWRSWAARVCAL